MANFDQEDFLCNYIYLKRFVRIEGNDACFRDVHGEFFNKYVRPLMTKEEVAEFINDLCEFDKVTHDFNSSVQLCRLARDGFYDLQEQLITEWYDRLRILDDYLPYSIIDFDFIYFVRFSILDID